MRAVEIIREPFDDRSEPDEEGAYEYVYVGTYFTFREGADQLRFSWYRDEPEVASLKDPIEWWIGRVPSSALFTEAVKYLMDHEGVKSIELLDPCPPGRGLIPMEEAVHAARSIGLPV
jgi:hypothetical protein